MASTEAMTRVLKEYRVSPPPGFEPKASVPLSFLDIFFLSEPPVERLFFYHFPHSTASFVESHLPNLKSSLSLTLQHFFVLAGTVHRSPNYNDKYEIYYRDGDAVNFTLAESEEDFLHLSSGRTRDFLRIHPLIPQLSASGDTRPLLAIQVTVFPNHGICIGVSVHHTAGDGSSIVRFLKAWASACKHGGDLEPPPIYDRTLLAEPPGLYSIFYNQRMEDTSPIVAEPSSSASQPNGVFASFTLGLDDIQRLKQRVAVSGKHAHCSTFVVSSAYAWVCLVRARGHASDRSAHMIFAVDCRGRLDPPVPTSYFGNCLCPCFVTANVGELVSEGGVVSACVAVGKAIEGLRDGVLKDAVGWVGRVKSVVVDLPLSIAGSPKFRVYDIDFGWGRPERVEIPSIMRSGAISLAETKDGGGGVEIGLGLLEKHQMDEFEAHFYNGLKI